MTQNSGADDAYAEALEQIMTSAASRGSSLELSGLGLTRLPPEVGLLTTIETLWLDDNQLTTLPEEVGNLKEVRSIFLMNNQLTALPAWLRDLPKLRYLFLHGNPALQLSPAVLGADPDGSFSEYASAKSILDFYFR